MSSPNGKALHSKKIRSTLLSILLAVIGSLLLILLYVEVLDYIPDNAIIYVDKEHNYYSPPLLWADSRPFHVRMSIDDARKRNIEHDSVKPTTDQVWRDVSEEFPFVWVHNLDNTWTEFQPQRAIPRRKVPGA